MATGAGKSPRSARPASAASVRGAEAFPSRRIDAEMTVRAVVISITRAQYSVRAAGNAVELNHDLFIGGPRPAVSITCSEGIGALFVTASFRESKVT